MGYFVPMVPVIQAGLARGGGWARLTPADGSHTLRRADAHPCAFNDRVMLAMALVSQACFPSNGGWAQLNLGPLCGSLQRSRAQDSVA
jgi:hypothetical protein